MWRHRAINAPERPGEVNLKINQWKEKPGRIEYKKVIPQRKSFILTAVGGK